MTISIPQPASDSGTVSVHAKASNPFGLGQQEIAHLLKRYDRQGPRYTSYPPATEFKPLTPQAYLAALEKNRQLDRIAPLSLYIHVPFCTSPCFYCGCNKIITKNRSAVREYLDHLRKEMALMRLQTDVHRRPVTQLHWGGGTPTFLDDAEMTELMHHTATYFNLSNQESRDYSIEVDPRSVSRERIDLLRGLGFNRISLGVQDFNPAVQQAINREQSFELVRDLTESIRARSFRSLNFDLIYGLPLQTLSSIEKTLQQVVELGPDRISYYNYAHLPERFAAQKAIRDEDLPSPEEKIAILSAIIEALTAAGYEYIGMDHFVKPDDPLAIAKREGTLCRNFQGYSVNKADDLVGLGVSSISEVQGVYGQNYVALDDYYRALDDNQLPVFKGLEMTDEDRLRRDVIQQLSCYRELDISLFEQRYGIDFNEHFKEALSQLNQHMEDGLIQREGSLLRITQKGCLLLRPLCMAFDEYLSKTPADNSAGVRPCFSRVI